MIVQVRRIVIKQKKRLKIVKNLPKRISNNKNKKKLISLMILMMKFLMSGE